MFNDNLPIYLQSVKALRNHFQQELEIHERGDSFVEFSQKIVPVTNMGKKYGTPEVNAKKTHDGGIDIFAYGNNGEVLCVQCKFNIPDVREFDSIISKFENYAKSQEKHPSQLSLFDDDSSTKSNHLAFMVICSNDLSRIREMYEKQNMSSKRFYDSLMSSDRLEVADGNTLVSILRGEFNQRHLRDFTVELEFETDVVAYENVFIGILSSDTLKNLYQDYGDSLFFENIRQYLGEYSGITSRNRKESEESVNQHIIRTVRNEPDNLLARNNGLTFKAKSVTTTIPRVLKLDSASIVNGCQTTISVVRYAKEKCCILAKVVQTEDAWDVTKVANYQNDVDRIYLDLSRYFRQPLLSRQATIAGVSLSSADSLLDAIHKDRVDYEEMRSLFIGLFSTNPNNALLNNYTKLKFDLLEFVFQDDPEGSQLFVNLFKLQSIVNDCMEYVWEKLEDDDRRRYRRFRDDHLSKISYSAYLTLLAACATLNMDISERSNVPAEGYKQISQFLSSIAEVVETDPKKIKENFLVTIDAVIFAIDKVVDQQSREMHKFFTVERFSELLNDIARLKKRYKNSLL